MDNRNPHRRLHFTTEGETSSDVRPTQADLIHMAAHGKTPVGSKRHHKRRRKTYDDDSDSEYTETVETHSDPLNPNEDMKMLLKKMINMQWGMNISVALNCLFTFVIIVLLVYKTEGLDETKTKADTVLDKGIAVLDDVRTSIVPDIKDIVVKSFEVVLSLTNTTASLSDGVDKIKSHLGIS